MWLRTQKNGGTNLIHIYIDTKAIYNLPRHRSFDVGDILPTMQQFRDSGKSLREISQELNRLGHTTRTGKKWNPVQVKRVIDGSTPG